MLVPPEYQASYGRIQSIKMRRNHPEKYKAGLVSQYIRFPDGFVGHHWSYNDEHFKDVIMLSNRDHRKAHRYLRYDKRSKMYMTLGGRLLDTREKHGIYISLIILREPESKGKLPKPKYDLVF